MNTLRDTEYELDDTEEGYDTLLEEPPEPVFGRRADFIYDPLRSRVGVFE